GAHDEALPIGREPRLLIAVGRRWERLFESVGIDPHEYSRSRSRVAGDISQRARSRDRELAGRRLTCLEDVFYQGDGRACDLQSALIERNSQNCPVADVHQLTS